MRYVKRIIVVVVIAGAAVLGGVGWVGSERALHPQSHGYKWSPADYPVLQGERVSFQSKDGTTLAGMFFRGGTARTIVLSHGYGDNQVQMLPYADFLHQAGFTIFTYDMRNRGQSGGDAVTIGARESSDLVSAVDYLAGRPDVDAQRIGAFGLSLGGSVTILAAAQDARMKAVVDDSGFSDAVSEIGNSFEHFIHLPAFPFARISVAIAERRAGINVTGIRPIDVVKRIGPRPFFIIHCAGDTVVPPSHSQALFAAAAEPKSMWLLPRGGHIEARTVDQVEYARRVTAFFSDALR
jgi:dipeptidyl aminopeptidase/acylaminoacyl peptidase